MGIVFKAFDTDLNRPVAVKILDASIAHKSKIGGVRLARDW